MVDQVLLAPVVDRLVADTDGAGGGAVKGRTARIQRLRRKPVRRPHAQPMVEGSLMAPNFGRSASSSPSDRIGARTDEQPRAGLATGRSEVASDGDGKAHAH